MFTYNKQLQYTVRVSEANSALANLLLEQFGGPQGEVTAAMSYFTQSLSEEDQLRKDMLMETAAEELSHLEILGSLIAMLNRGAKGEGAQVAFAQADSYRSLTQNFDGLAQILLYGGGPALANSSGMPWTAAYIGPVADPACDLRSNIAAESRARLMYSRLADVAGDAGVKDTLMFLASRESAHQKTFEKALYSIEKGFPPAKLRGIPKFMNRYATAPRGDGGCETAQSMVEKHEVTAARRETRADGNGADGSP